MRNVLLIFLATTLAMSAAAAEPSIPRKSTTAVGGQRLAAKQRGPRNPCAAYGPGFLKVEGSDTCVKVGGSISLGVGGRR
jgi:hypothetical protein